MSMTCTICDKHYTEELRRKVTCAHCGFSACRACTRTYIETANANPGCMNPKCFKEWDRDFINRNFPTSWINGQYRELRRNLLVEQEKALLPSSQVMVNNYRLAASVLMHIEHLDDNIEQLQQKLKLLRRKRSEAYTTYVNASANNYRGRNDGIKNVYSNKACPNEACRGFLDAAEWRCGLCRVSVCRTCYVALTPGEPHTCRADDVASMQVIEESSKPCPNCHMAIVKTDGCDQMWCTSCHTAFSWTTGDIVRGRIHNPMYYAHQARPREVGDIPCGGLCHLSQLREAFLGTAVGMHLANTSEFYKHPLFSFHQLVQETSEVQKRLHRLRSVHNRLDHSDLRLQYLLDRISEEQWKSMLYSRENLREKNIMIRQVYETFLWSVSETLSAFVTGQMDLSTASEQLKFLQKAANTGLSNIESGFGLKCPRIKLPTFVMGRSYR